VCDSVEEVDARILREYLVYLRKRNRYDGHAYTPAQNQLLSTATIHGHVRTLRAFFGWAAREELIEINPAAVIKPPRIASKVITTLSDEEIRAIINVFNPRLPSDSRNQTIFMVLLDTGLRIGELIGLKVCDIHLDDGLLKVVGKGNKERIVPIGSNAQRALQRYLFRYRSQPADASVENVFLSNCGRPLTDNSVKLMFSRLARKSGVARLHARLCRHTFATRS
jgi:integrase/recombinase XerD